MTSDIKSEPTKDNAEPQRDKPQEHNLNMADLVKPGDFANVTKGPNSAEQYLPQDFHLADDEETHGNTTTRKDDQGNIKEYDNGNCTLSKHNDNKWYYHENGDDNKYVEVNGDSIKMSDQGKVTYNESGFLGKDNQTLGDGSTNFMSSLTSAANHVEDAVVNHPLDTFNKLAFMPLAAADAITGTHSLDVVKNLEVGAVNEVIHHPGEILKDVAIGAGIGALTVATGGGFAVALAIGATAAIATEAIKNSDNPKGIVNGMIDDAKGMVNSVEQWGQDAAIVGGTGDRYTQEQKDAAAKGLQSAGAFGAQTVAGIAGGVAGGMGAAAAGLDGAIPNTVRSMLGSRGVPSTEIETLPNSTPLVEKAPGSTEVNSEQAINPEPAPEATVPKAATPEEIALQAKVDASVAKNQTVFDGSVEVTPSLKQAYNVRFEKVSEPTQVQTLEGLESAETQTANPGDWIATRLNADGTPNIEHGIENKWTIKQNKIAKTYQVTPEELEGQTSLVAGTRTDAPPVNMVQLTEPLTIDTPWGSMSGKPGDYLANYDFDPATGKPGSDYAIVTKTSYDQTYSPVTESQTDSLRAFPTREQFTESNTTMNVGNKEDWKGMVEANGTDSYGAPILHFANDWAVKMEKLAGDGPLTRQIVDDASHSADWSDQMSGFSYSIARNALIKTWSRGAELGEVLGE